MFVFIMSLVACGTTTRSEEMHSFELVEMTIARDDSKGVIPVPSGTIISVENCGRILEEGPDLCHAIPWGEEDGFLYLHITAGTEGRVIYIKETEEEG